MKKLIQILPSGECVPKADRYEVYKRLAEYEKTELSPESVEELKDRYFEEVVAKNAIIEICAKPVMKHPVETRQDKFLKIIPNAYIDSDGVIDIAPCTIEKGKYGITNQSCTMSHKYTNCGQCRKEYWLAEVDEND